MKDGLRFPTFWSQSMQPSRNLGFTDLSRWMDDLWKNDFPAVAPSFSPRLDVKETPTELKILAELPGVEENDIKVEFHDSTLSIRGEKKTESEEKDEAYHRVERTYGSFMRQVMVPNYVDPEKMSAEFKNGLLTITLAKKTNGSTKRTIEIKK